MKHFLQIYVLSLYSPYVVHITDWCDTDSRNVLRLMCWVFFIFLPPVKKSLTKLDIHTQSVVRHICSFRCTNTFKIWFHHFTHLIMHNRYLHAWNLLRLLYCSEEKVLETITSLLKFFFKKLSLAFSEATSTASENRQDVAWQWCKI